MTPQLQREAPASESAEITNWSLVTRIAFRFVFSYFVLNVYPRTVGSLPAGVNYSNPLRDMWHAIVPWVGIHVLHLTGDFTEVANGSGDQLYDYVLIFCIFVTAVLATAIWSWIDRRRPNYRVLYQWLRLFIRIVVSVAMISYGANKLWRMQFPEPGLARYVDTFGQISPMGLLWAFMGMSRTYSFFAGTGEMLGGLLLIIPRFTALGALVSLGVLSNVLVLNFCYDVPRKIYCIHLILFCLFLLLPDIRKIADFFIFNRQTRLSPPVPLFNDRLLNYGVWVLQIGIGVAAILVCSNQAYRDAVKNASHLQPPLRGIWSVDEFELDGNVRPPLLTDTERWQRVIFDDPDILTLQAMDGTQKKFDMQLDQGTKSLTLGDAHNTQTRTALALDESRPDHITLDGQFGGHHVSAHLKRVDMSDPKKFLLLNRGMNWINAYPNIR